MEMIGAGRRETTRRKERLLAQQFAGQQARQLKGRHGAQHALRLNFLATGKSHAAGNSPP